MHRHFLYGVCVPGWDNMLVWQRHALYGVCVYVHGWENMLVYAQTFLIWCMCICPWMRKHVSLCTNISYMVYVYMSLDGKTCLCGRDISYMVYVYNVPGWETCYFMQRHFLYGVCVYVPGWENMFV